jgi:hypothetical protein
MAKKFTLTKEVDYKNGQMDIWYMVRLEHEDGSKQIIDLVKDDEEKAHELLNLAIKKWVPSSKSVIKEVVVEA